MIGKETLELLKEALSESSYTVAVCGSGMLEEGGILGLKQEGRACEIEQEYGQSPEELFHISCFSRRPELFYDFYRREILEKIPRMTPSVEALTEMERRGMLQCIVTTSIYDLPRSAETKNVIYLHGGYMKYMHPLREALFHGIHKEFKARSPVWGLRPYCPPRNIPVRGNGGQPDGKPHHTGDIQGRRTPCTGNKPALRCIQSLYPVFPGKEDDYHPQVAQAAG